MKITVACLTLVFTIATARNVENPQYYCGRSLGLALDSICSGWSNFVEEQENLVPTTAPSPSSTPAQSWAWMNGKRYKEAEELRHRSIVEECCLSPCYLKQLLAYCQV